MSGETGDLFARAWECLSSREPEPKLAATDAATRDWWLGLLEPESGEEPRPATEVGQPERPKLVHPRRLSRRTLATEEGRAALLHAVAHIEFNAINLAWDAVYRFRGMPRDYYQDWIRVAAEEAAHFRLLRNRLRELGRDYGDFPAHSGLWDMARRTAHDPLVRMALVPRVLEARGLDVTPGMIERFRGLGDQPSVQVLEVILAEEVGHVKIGSRWFGWLCERRGLPPEQTYFRFIEEYLNNEVRCPLHREARLQAGFSEAELERLEGLCRKT